MDRSSKRKKKISTHESQDMFSSSDEEYVPPADEKLNISNGEIYEHWKSYSDKPTIIAFIYMILFQVLSTKPYPQVPLNIHNQPLRDFTTDEVQVKEQLDEAIDRLVGAFKNFKKAYINNKSGRKAVSKGGSKEHDLFFDLLEEYPLLVREQASQRSTASSQRSTASYLEEEAPKPSRRTRKKFSELGAPWKRQQTNDIYKRLQELAGTLKAGFNGLLAYLGFRGNYMTDKKIANAFYALGNQELQGSLSLDRALHLKYRYKLSKRDWIDLHYDLESNLQMPTDKELRSFEYKLLPDEMLHPFEKGWFMKIKDIIQSTLQRLPREVNYIFS